MLTPSINHINSIYPAPSLFNSIVQHHLDNKLFLPPFLLPCLSELERFVGMIYDIYPASNYEVKLLNSSAPFSMDDVSDYLDKALYSLPPKEELCFVNSSAFAQYLILDFKPLDNTLDLLVMASIKKVLEQKLASFEREEEYSYASPTLDESISFETKLKIERLREKYIYLSDTLQELTLLMSRLTIEEALKASTTYEKYAALFLVMNNLTKQHISMLNFSSTSVSAIPNASLAGPASLLTRAYTYSIGYFSNTTLAPNLQHCIETFKNKDLLKMQEIFNTWPMFKSRFKRNLDYTKIIDDFLLLAFFSVREHSSEVIYPPDCSSTLNFLLHLSPMIRVRDGQLALNSYLNALPLLLPQTFQKIDFIATFNAALLDDTLLEGVLDTLEVFAIQQNLASTIPEKIVTKSKLSNKV